MSLDPHRRDAWNDMLGLLRPPERYDLAGAVVTTFGLGLDALVATLLAALGVEEESLTRDPLATVIAATRLAPKVRVFVQAGTISGAFKGMPRRLACLLDRVVIPVKLDSGLYHPKILVSHFKAQNGRAANADVVRVLIGSRNLTSSCAFEMGVFLEGRVGKSTTDLGRQVADLLAANLQLRAFRCAAVTALVKTLRTVDFAPVDAGRGAIRLHWQGPRGRSHSRLLPKEIKRALIVSPYLSSSFLNRILEHAEEVKVISSETAYRQLGEETFDALVKQGDRQRSTSMYVVEIDKDMEDQLKIDGLHAKLMVLEGKSPADTVTFLGSANATAPGWAIATTGNAESLVELRPGLSITRLMRDFVEDKRGTPRPWIQAYEPGDRTPLTEDEEIDEELRHLVREAASLAFCVAYAKDKRELTLTLSDRAERPNEVVRGRSAKFECLPLAFQETNRNWIELSELQKRGAVYPDAELTDASAFVLVRVSSGANSKTRIALAELLMTDALLEERDADARKELLADVEPLDVLSALVLGLAHVRSPERRSEESGHSSGGKQLARALDVVSLERLLQALAKNPELVRELRMLVLDESEPVFLKFRNDVEAVLDVSAGVRA